MADTTLPNLSPATVEEFLQQAFSTVWNDQQERLTVWVGTNPRAIRDWAVGYLRQALGAACISAAEASLQARRTVLEANVDLLVLAGRAHAGMKPTVQQALTSHDLAALFLQLLQEEGHTVPIGSWNWRVSFDMDQEVMDSTPLPEETPIELPAPEVLLSAPVRMIESTIASGKVDSQLDALLSAEQARNGTGPRAKIISALHARQREAGA